ncbi:hypothetical protein HP439_00190 [Sphingobacterium shayense]|nr:hypothetical protein [Sphingobacterium shayense]NQD69137.1 hypothetical protein [Sphingobacterium shayense]
MELKGAEEPFDIEIDNVVYSVFPEEKDVYVVFKEGREYIKLLKDTENSWLMLNPETELPMFGMDEEVDRIGKKINEELRLGSDRK